MVLLLQRDNLLLQGADQLQAGAVADVRQSRIGVSAEVALTDSAIVGAVEQRAVGLQLPDPVRRLLGVQLGHTPVVQELSTAHRVAEVSLPIVLRVGVAHRGRAAASAMTVWALPNRDLHTTATFKPRSRASMTARNPAPPAPITTTS